MGNTVKKGKKIGVWIKKWLRVTVKCHRSRLISEKKKGEGWGVAEKVKEGNSLK